MEVSLVKENLKKPDLSKYKIPEHFIDNTFGFYEIHLKCNDMTELRKRLYFIPVNIIESDKNDSLYT